MLITQNAQPALERYRAELQRLRTLRPDQLAEAIDATPALWLDVKVVTVV